MLPVCATVSLIRIRGQEPVCVVGIVFVFLFGKIIITIVGWLVVVQLGFRFCPHSLFREAVVLL